MFIQRLQPPLIPTIQSQAEVPTKDTKQKTKLLSLSDGRLNWPSDREESPDTFFDNRLYLSVVSLSCHSSGLSHLRSPSLLTLPLKHQSATRTHLHTQIFSDRNVSYEHFSNAEKVHDPYRFILNICLFSTKIFCIQVLLDLGRET